MSVFLYRAPLSVLGNAAGTSLFKSFLIEERLVGKLDISTLLLWIIKAMDHMYRGVSTV